jgi:hypothetical protein
MSNQGTMLFTDVVGFSKVTEAADREQLVKRIDDYFRVLIRSQPNMASKKKQSAMRTCTPADSRLHIRHTWVKRSGLRGT